ncbi:MAG: enolase C-terminal domain-like protein [SAR202 cluster bacterium]|jgi:L-alanine-DL-glutamate epimerase-like enolase superfamily enzyme|nr:enolase C-terminal domain-like protein [SAR202 cluster bacterium]
MPGQKITDIRVTPIPVHYRKEVGKVAFADNIGSERTEWLVRARTDGGLEGYTIANRFMGRFAGFHSSEGTVRGLVALLREVFLGSRVDDFLEVSEGRVTGVRDAYKQVFFSHGWMSILAYDLLGQDLGVSCTDLFGGRIKDWIPAYDTSLFYQDMSNPEKGAAQVAADAADSRRDGYNAFKIKVGRAGRWMMPQEGLQRDVEVVLAVREAAGADASVMVDGNFGYDGRMDLLEDFVRETLPAKLFWMEEMVTADVGDYRVLRRMRDRLGSTALLVCGEEDGHPPGQEFVDLVSAGLIDGYQPDIVAAGFSRWQELTDWLAPTGVLTQPRNFGNGNLGRRAALVFGASSPTFVSLEDERFLPNVYADDDVAFHNGSYSVPSGAGLGLAIDSDIYQRKYAAAEVRIT